VLAEFEWPVSPFGPWGSHFGAAALGYATNVIAHQQPLLGTLCVQRIQSIPIIRVLAVVVLFFHMIIEICPVAKVSEVSRSHACGENAR
jgi:hypothetical protein